jgi:hypothetical protein
MKTKTYKSHVVCCPTVVSKVRVRFQTIPFRIFGGQVGTGTLFFSTYLCFLLIVACRRGTRWYSWLRHCTTNRKVAGSIPDFVIGIFYLYPSGLNKALGLTQPVTEMSTRNISWWVKAAGA